MRRRWSTRRRKCTWSAPGSWTRSARSCCRQWAVTGWSWGSAAGGWSTRRRRSAARPGAPRARYAQPCALLSGYAIDAAWYGLHHVMSQTLVRVGGAGHGQANAAMLPHTIAALERRQPGYVDPDESLRDLARRLAEQARADGISKIGVER